MLNQIEIVNIDMQNTKEFDVGGNWACIIGCGSFCIIGSGYTSYVAVATTAL